MKKLLNIYLLKTDPRSTGTPGTACLILVNGIKTGTGHMSKFRKILWPEFYFYMECLTLPTH